MTSKLQKEAARKNIRKAQAKWKSMSHRQHALAQPQGRSRAKPGEKGEGEFYRVVLRSKNQFTTFRTQDVGRKGHAERLAGKRANGNWDTQAWLINKKDAHVEGNKLVADTEGTKKILNNLSTVPIHVKGDIFKAKDRRDIPEKEKPTAKQKKARKTNIKKAQTARRKKK